MAGKIDRAWKYIICSDCGSSFLLDKISVQNGNLKCPECRNAVKYDEEVEQQWLNEVNEKGERVRMDFEGKSEDDCREKAAQYYKCDKRQIVYNIVQRSGLFKPFIICASRPIEYEEDSNATKIIMWEYEGVPKEWILINPDQKTFICPYEFEGKKIHYDFISGLEYDKTYNLAGIRYYLELYPQGKVALTFLPGYEQNVVQLIKLIKNDLKVKKHGVFTEEYYVDFFNRTERSTTEICNITFSYEKFSYSAKMRVWRSDNKLNIYDLNTQILFSFLLDEIKYYRILGEKYVTTEISGGGGGGSSIKGAIIGGVVAGQTGAIIGSRKGNDEIKSSSIIHDDREVLLYSAISNQTIHFNADVYKVFTKIIPEKDYDVVINDNNIEGKIDSNSDNLEMIEKLADLNKKGIITDDEFETKKKEILRRI